MLLSIAGAKAEDVYNALHAVGDWSAQQLPLSDYPMLGNAKAGDVIAITVSALTGESPRITLQDIGWKGIDEQYITATGVYYFVLSSANAAKIAGSGLIVTGVNYTFNKVELMYKKTLWSGVLDGIGDWEQSDVIDNSLFSDLQEGSILGITVSKINTGDWHNVVLRYNYESNIIDQGVSTPQTILYSLTSGDVTKLKDEEEINLVARYLCITELCTYTTTISEDRPRAASLLPKTMNSLWPKAGETGVTTGTTVTNNVITMGEYESGDSWGGAGYWLESSGSYFDASSYGKVVVRFSSAAVTNGGVNIKYKDNDAESKDYVYQSFEAGAKEVVIELDANRKQYFKELTIQGPQKAEFNVADVYFASSNYFALNDEVSSTITAVNDCYVEFTRTFAAGWNSLCLPFATTASALGCTAYEFVSATTSSVTFSEVSDLTAGKPYLVKYSSETSNLTFEDVDITATSAGYEKHDGVTFQGVYSRTDGADKYGVVSNGDIKKGVTGSYFNGYRAYFTGLSTSSARVMIMDDSTTGINNVKALNLNENHDIYTLSGVKVNGQPQKGIYIKDGKKFIVK